MARKEQEKARERIERVVRDIIVGLISTAAWELMVYVFTHVTAPDPEYLAQRARDAARTEQGLSPPAQGELLAAAPLLSLVVVSRMNSVQKGVAADPAVNEFVQRAVERWPISNSAFLYGHLVKMIHGHLVQAGITAAQPVETNGFKA